MDKQKVKKRSPFEICQDIYLSELVKIGNRFNTEKLNKKVLESGGMLRLSPANPPKLLIEELVNLGYLKYDWKKEEYEVIESYEPAEIHQAIEQNRFWELVAEKLILNHNLI
jgi:hypothetical protein